MSSRHNNLYSRKKRWKLFLLFAAVIIVVLSLWYSNVLVHKIAQDERAKIQTWANAINHRLTLVNSTSKFFGQIRTEERKRVELYAEAQKRASQASVDDESLSFYYQIIENNSSIPVILTDEEGNINTTRNVDFDPQKVKKMTPELKKEFSVYPPIVFDYYQGNLNYMYYKDSKLFTEVQNVLDEIVNSFFREVVENSAAVPVVITDSTRRYVIASGNVDADSLTDSVYLKKLTSEMASQNDPIEIKVADRGKNYIYYKDSYTLTQLRYLPYFLFAIIGVFLLVAYVLFSMSRRSEQNQVWVGLAKETAHQLGTPLSSMMAWIDYLETKGIDSETINELQKDVNRLQTVTERFSKIGSTPVLKPENVVALVYNAVEYLKTRTSQKVQFSINVTDDKKIMVPLNYQLFDWVIENLVKNAVDAMAGKGKIKIDIFEDDATVRIDVQDTGKGIARNMFQTIFNPGFSSKQRGWGLGLSLSKRIISEYHKGKIFVKESTLGKGTTFRIVLRK
ncbi:MAG TPA: HAMP domain-containing sensor histidine kinase [Bacteroidales bacterium]|jgi:signal transduction histidine kinase|nr:HAMP domain-containing sensor histidine kinase [Bacteroidales bacterium]